MAHNEITPIPQVHTYVTPLILARAFSEGVTLTPDEEAMDAIEATTRRFHESFSYPLVDEERVTASGLAVVIRAHEATDSSWKDAAPTQVYHPIDQLQRRTVAEVMGVRKCDIMRIGRPLVELTVADFDLLGTAMASKLTGSFTHGNRTWRTIATLTGSTGATSGAANVGMNWKRTQAVNAVENAGLRPFIVGRKGGQA